MALMSLSPRGAMPLGELGYEIADSVEVIMNNYEPRDVKFSDRRRLSILRARSNDTIYGSSWFSSVSNIGRPHSYVFWTDEDTISFYGEEATPPIANSMPDENTAVRNTTIDLSGAEYDPENLGYFITYVIILNDGKFTIKSHRTHQGRTM